MSENLKKALESAREKAEELEALEAAKLKPGTVSPSSITIRDLIREIEQALHYLTKPRC